jgi:hypothetical protein
MRLDDLVEAVGQTVGQRIDLLEEEMGGLREELQSEIADFGVASASSPCFSSP